MSIRRLLFRLRSARARLRLVLAEIASLDEHWRRGVFERRRGGRDDQ
jgi:hypothetical protein